MNNDALSDLNKETRVIEDHFKTFSTQDAIRALTTHFRLLSQDQRETMLVAALFLYGSQRAMNAIHGLDAS